MSTKTKTSTPTWFQVRRLQGDYFDRAKPWTISYRTISTLSKYAKPGWGGDFATKAEAVAHGEAKGWILVSKWDEAITQSRPIVAEHNAQSDRIKQAREGLTELRIGNHRDEYKIRYITPERARALLAELGDPDEYGVVR